MNLQPRLVPCPGMELATSHFAKRHQTNRATHQLGLQSLFLSVLPLPAMFLCSLCSPTTWELALLTIPLHPLSLSPEPTPLRLSLSITPPKSIRQSAMISMLLNPAFNLLYIYIFELSAAFHVISLYLGTISSLGFYTFVFPTSLVTSSVFLAVSSTPTWSLNLDGVLQGSVFQLLFSVQSGSVISVWKL